MQHIDTSWGDVAFDDRGDGPAVVLLHATAHDHHDFDDVVPQLNEAGFRTIAVDWPGHGGSTWRSDPATMGATALRHVLGQLLDSLDLADVAIIGSSVGGYAAAGAAIDRPARVERVVLVNAGGFLKPNPVTRTVCRIIGNPAANRTVMKPLVPAYMRATSDLDAAIVSRVRAHLSSADGTASTAALWRSFADDAYDLRADAGRITCPVLLVWGTRDLVLGGSKGRRTQRAIPGSRLVTLRTGHVPFASAPVDFLRAVLPFLRERA